MSSNKSKPEHIQKLDERDETIKQLVQATDYGFRKARVHGEEKLTEDGELQYDKLEDTEVRQEVIDSLFETYKEHAEEFIETETDIDDPEGRLVQLHYSLSRDQLESMFSTKGRAKKFLSSYESELSKQVITQLREQLRDKATEHLEPGHIDDLIQHTPGAEDELEGNYFEKKGHKVLQDAIDLYRESRDKGRFATTVKEQLGAYYEAAKDSSS